MDAAPIIHTVDDLRSNGRDITIAGWTEDGRRCLIIDRTGEQVAIASRSTVNGIGRWECTTQHYDAYRDVYDPRFPMVDDPTVPPADDADYYDPHPSHDWHDGRETRQCQRCGTREAYWDDEEYGIDPCSGGGMYAA